VGQTISGTIDGLVEGSNDGTGLTVTVTSTPTGQLLGGGFNFFNTYIGGNAFTVTGGNVTFADASFIDNSFVTSKSLSLGGYGGYGSLLQSIPSYNPQWYGGQTTFTPISSTPVPEPVTILGSLVALGVGTVFKRKSSAQ
jgi:hypothetical protein